MLIARLLAPRGLLPLLLLQTLKPRRSRRSRLKPVFPGAVWDLGLSKRVAIGMVRSLRPAYCQPFRPDMVCLDPMPDPTLLDEALTAARAAKQVPVP